MILSRNQENYSWTQHYLKGNIVSNAKRISKFPHFLRGIASHSLRWISPDSAFLSEAGSQTFVSKVSQTIPSFPRFSALRHDPGHSLRHHRWDGAGHRDPDPAVQWGLPEDCGTQ